MKQCLNRCCTALTCCFASWFLLVVWLVSQAHGQSIFPGCQSPTTVVARSANVAPVGDLKFRSYRLDESADGIFCLSVTLDEPYGNFLIWVGDDPLWAQHLRKGELTASFPPQWLQQDAPISVSRTLRPYELTTHPERLTLPDSLKRQLEGARSGERMKITSLRRVTRKVDGTSKRFVIVMITGSKPFGGEAMNNSWVIQIGRKEFGAWPERDALTCTMTEEEFAALEDGAPVRVNLGFDRLRGGGAGKSFARLDKSVVIDSN